MKIAVFGKLRCGKTEVCKYLQDNLDDCEVYEFSDALREVCDIVYPKTKNRKDREKLIAIGQHLRKLDKDIWVNVVRHKIENSSAKNIIVSSIRQANEVQMLKEMGFVFIRVDSSESARIERCKKINDNFDPSSLNHNTETELDTFEYDYLIQNERGFKELEIEIGNVLEDLKTCECLKKKNNKELLDGWINRYEK